MLNVIIEMKLFDYPQHYHIFGRQREPGDTMIGENGMIKRLRPILTKLGFSSDYTLYSFKHTGVIRAYQSGVGIKGIQLQCGHANPETTDIYLKSLGLGDNKEFIDRLNDVEL